MGSLVRCAWLFRLGRCPQDRHGAGSVPGRQGPGNRTGEGARQGVRPACA